MLMKHDKLLEIQDAEYKYYVQWCMKDMTEGIWENNIQQRFKVNGTYQFEETLRKINVTKFFFQLYKRQEQINCTLVHIYRHA